MLLLPLAVGVCLGEKCRAGLLAAACLMDLTRDRSVMVYQHLGEFVLDSQALLPKH